MTQALELAPVTLLPLVFVIATTMTAGVEMCVRFLDMIAGGQTLRGVLNLGMTVFIMVCVGVLLLLAVGRWLGVARGIIPVRPETVAAALPNGAAEVREPVSAQEMRIPNRGY